MNLSAFFYDLSQFSTEMGFMIIIGYFKIEIHQISLDIYKQFINV